MAFGKEIAAVAASSTAWIGLNWKLSQTSITNWRGGEMRQGGSAENTGGGKEGTTQGIHWTSEHPRNGAPTGCLRKWTVDRQ